jgi:hypothetical protein
MRGVSDPYGRAEDAEADEENRFQYDHYLNNTYLYGRVFVVRGEVFNDILHTDQWNLRRSGISPRQDQEGEKT